MSELTPTVASLRRRHAENWNDEIPYNPLALRTHRAIRWLEPARRERESDDLDVAFVLYWIAFNAAYAREVSKRPQTREELAEYFGTILCLDQHGRIFNALWDRFADLVDQLLRNHYLYGPFWDHENGKKRNPNWRREFEREVACATQAHREATRSGTKTVLTILFERLYTLRNQLVHGGATWKSSINRKSVEPGVRIMEFLIPIFIEIMLDDPEREWGPPYYRYLPALRMDKRTG